MSGFFILKKTIVEVPPCFFTRVDMNAYSEALDDFGDDDFM